MSAGRMKSLVRGEMHQRREGRRLTDALTEACRRFLTAARHLDEVSARRHGLWLSDTTTYAEDQAAEGEKSAAFEACFLAAVAFDDLLPFTGGSSAEMIKVMAQLAAPAPREWIRGGCSGDGRTGVAYHDDGRGRTTAILTAYGQVIPTRSGSRSAGRCLLRRSGHAHEHADGAHGQAPRHETVPASRWVMSSGMQRACEHFDPAVPKPAYIFRAGEVRAFACAECAGPYLAQLWDPEHVHECVRCHGTR